MKPGFDPNIAYAIKDFALPRYDELPGVGLYLEQTAKYITEILMPLNDAAFTGSMISNYVKKDLITNPVKKMYDRDQIARLVFIAVAKAVLSIDDIKLLINLQSKTYPTRIAYDYFCSELENVLQFVFGLKADLDMIGVDDTAEKNILRSTIITVCYKIYLDKHCSVLQNGAVDLQ